MDQLRTPMTVYFVTRFSICDSQFRGFRLTVDHDEKAYEKKLFRKDRLDQKFATFEAITFRSVVQQSCDYWKWLIYTSDRMPDAYTQRLHSLVKNYQTIEVIAVKDFADFFERHNAYGYGSSFATVRLDDDDGLAASYVEKLQNYSENTGSVVSFTEGSFVRCTKGRIVVGETISAKNCALGLAGIGIRIYLTGKHTDIHTRYNVIYDQSPGMFFLCCSPFTDTHRGFTRSARAINKFRRLLFLTLHRPTDARKEFVQFIKRRWPSLRLN